MWGLGVNEKAKRNGITKKCGIDRDSVNAVKQDLKCRKRLSDRALRKGRLSKGTTE